MLFELGFELGLDLRLLITACAMARTMCDEQRRLLEMFKGPLANISF
jgi:hypothetical protein